MSFVADGFARSVRYIAGRGILSGICARLAQRSIKIGKDIAIIGMPHISPIAYYMLAYSIDHNIQIEEPKYRKVTYESIRFPMMTYKNVLLQEIQMYCISSELEQSVGRARVLREDCAVHVFSDFSVLQAEIDKEDYLN